MTDVRVGDEIIRFPDSMTEEEITAALRRLYPLTPDQMDAIERLLSEGREDDARFLLRRFDAEANPRLDEIEAEIERRRRLREIEVEIPVFEGEGLGLLPTAALGGLTLAFGWVVTRRTLLAARPHMTRKWFGVFGSTVWKCGRCGNQVALGTARCDTCGQSQKWPKWSTPEEVQREIDLQEGV